MADPVSWLMVEPGWKVTAADGTDVGRVAEVIGDSNEDIFNGLSIASGPLARPRYLPAEQVGEIVEGEVRIALTREQVELLDEHDQPPSSSQVVPEQSPPAWSAPGPTRRVPLVQRLAGWLGLRGRR